MHLSKKHYLIAGGSVALAVALGIGAAELPRRPKTVEVTEPESTVLHVTLDQAVASDENRAGDHFEATVSAPVVIDGKTVIPSRRSERRRSCGGRASLGTPEGQGQSAARSGKWM